MASTVRLNTITPVPKDFPLKVERVEELVGRDAIRKARVIHQKDLVYTTITVHHTGSDLSSIDFCMYVVGNTDYVDFTSWALVKVKFLDDTMYLCRVRQTDINQMPFTVATIDVKADILAVLDDDTEEEHARGKHCELLGRKLRYGKKEEG